MIGFQPAIENRSRLIHTVWKKATRNDGFPTLGWKPLEINPKKLEESKKNDGYAIRN